MIRGFGGERLTPKEKAASLIDDAMAVLLGGYWAEHENTYDEDGRRTGGLTELEIEKVTDQLEKYQARINKVIGYTRG